MMPIADLTFDEQLIPPVNRFCDISNHVAPELWQPDPNQNPTTVKFYKIKSKITDIKNKYVCELCLILAQYIKENQK